MQSLLGAIPVDFTDYWISRFPRVLSHSYHALELCSKENAFLAYYPKSYIFSKPDYFYEHTEDFVPTELPKIVRDSPKRFNKDNRYNKYNGERRASPNDIENIGQNFRGFNKAPPGFENFVKTNKKGAYNFHRPPGDLTVPQQPLIRQPSPQPSRQPSPQPSPQPSAQPSAQPSPQPSPLPVEEKYPEDEDGFKLVKPKHNNLNVRNRKADGAKTGNDQPIVWTLPIKDKNN